MKCLALLRKVASASQQVFRLHKSGNYRLADKRSSEATVYHVYYACNDDDGLGKAARGRKANRSVGGSSGYETAT